MAIKVNFADAFLQSYSPGAQQGAHQWQQMQRQKQQEQQFQLERADALQRQEQQQAMQQQAMAFNQGQATRGQHLDERRFEAQNLDRAQDRLGSITAQQGKVDQAMSREGAAGKLSLMLREARAKPEIAGDAVLGGQLELAEQIAANPDSDPIQLLKEVDSIYEQAGVRRGAQENQADYQSMFGANVQQQQAIADALEQTGDLEGAQSVRERIMSSRSAFGPAWVQPEKAGDAYKSASEILHPWRKGGSTSAKKEKEPYSYAEALKLAQGSIDKEDAVRAKKALQAAARKAGKSEEEIDDIEGPTVLELQKQAAREIQAEMNPQPTSQGAPSQAQMRTQPGGMGPGPGPQQMNGQPQAQAPAQAAPVQAPAQPVAPAPRTAKDAGLAPEQASAMEEVLFQAALSGNAPEGIEDLNSVPLDVRKRIAVRLAREQKKKQAAGDAASSKRASQRENVGPNF